MTSPYNKRENTLAVAAGVVVGFTIDSAMGLMGYLGVPNTQLNNSLYFMFLGLRVVDAFVLASEFGHHTMLNAELSVAKRVSRTACSGGMSFPIVSATDALASLVRTTTVLPALDWLCTWAGVATIFTGCLCAIVLVAIGTTSLAFPVPFITVCRMKLWHYPRQRSLGHLTVVQTQNFQTYEISSGSYLYIPAAYVRNRFVAIGHATMIAIGTTSLAAFLQTGNSLFYKGSSES